MLHFCNGTTQLIFKGGDRYMTDRNINSVRLCWRKNGLSVHVTGIILQVLIDISLKEIRL